MITIRFSRNVPIRSGPGNHHGRAPHPPGQTAPTGLSRGWGPALLLAGGIRRRARELARLGINAGEPILICLDTFQGHGDKYAASARWRVYRAPQRMGQQKDGTFIVPAIPGSMADKAIGGKR